MTFNEDAFGTYIEGFIPYTYQGETFQTYYKSYGTLEGRTQTPLVILHGGPGFIHNYMLPHADLVKELNIPVIFYDQIGNGQSTHLKGKPNSFWTLDLFLNELDNLVQHLGIQDSFDILGHSSGGVMGVEYAIQRQESGLRRLILANTPATSGLWAQSTTQLLQKFPSEVVESIGIGMQDLTRYYEAMKIFYAKHGCTVKPPPSEYTETLDAVFGPDGDTTVLNAFWDTDRFFSKWSSIDRLHTVKAITLVVNGHMDLGQDFVCLPFFHKIPKCKWVRFEGSSHTSFWEERERYMQVIGGFLTADLDP